MTPQSHHYKLLQGEAVEHLSLSDDDKKGLLQISNDLGLDETYSSLLNGVQIDGSWLISDKYLNMDMNSWLLSKCNTDKERNRIKLEVALLKYYNVYSILKICMYIVDLANNREVILGVGRGSSVCLYSLYLIGLHKINSLKYDLPLEDFFKKIPQEILDECQEHTKQND